MAASGRVCGVSFRNTRGGIDLAEIGDDAVAVSFVSTVPPASMTSSLCRPLSVTRCTVLPKPSRNCSGSPQPGTRTCQSTTRWPLKGAGVSRRLCTV